MRNILAIDIGGTNIKYGVISLDGQILFKGSVETIRKGTEILETIVKLFLDNKETYNLEGVGISSPGIINSDTGAMKVQGALEDFNDFNLRDILRDRLKTNVEIENDAKCVVLAEKWLGNGKECETFLVMTIGTGVGGGAFINNKLHKGADFMAGEIGFMITSGINNNTPSNSTISNTCSTYMLRRLYAQRTNKKIEDVSGEYVFEQAEKGDIHAQDQIVKFYESLSIALHNLYFILNPDKILIGGGISVREDIIYELKRRVDSYSSFGKDFVLERCEFSNDSGIIGAVKNYMDRVN
ncbi:ROK family protein [uncultured Clostridium sp.]|jgi:beta-glucoside kinase|uniref:ROK family protein n=1 Tax=uncultured Clostridium sp. TaxID=59620 RepID=UPI0026084763|nr:ROK family protein [uncultured Clostridium sp.]